MTDYVVTDESGKEIKPGDTITDFRGHRATFVSVTRGPEYNGTAKVQIREADGYERELYAQVFNLTVTGH